VQGGHARCGRSCSAAAAGGSAREQWGRAWRTSEAVEEKAAHEVKRHCELLVENLEVARHGPQRWPDAGGRGGCSPGVGRPCSSWKRRGGYGAASPEGEAAKRRLRPGATSSEKPRCSQTQRAPFTHAEVGQEQRGAGSTRSARLAAVVGHP
jgi:hypothetical protein